MNKAQKDLLVIFIIAICVFVVSYFFDVFVFLVRFFRKHPESITWIDEIVTGLLTLSISFAIFSWRRWRELKRETTARIRLQEEMLKQAQTKAEVESIICKQLHCDIEKYKEIERGVLSRHGKAKKIGVLLFALLLSGAGSLLALQNAQELTRQGADLAKKGDYRQALTYFKRAIEIDPSCAEAYANRGLLYNQRGDFSLAMADCSMSINIYPQYPLANYCLGKIYSDNGRADTALIYLKKAVELDPRLSDAYYELGLANTLRGDYEQALASFSKAQDLDANSAEVYYGRSSVYFKQGKFSEALTDINSAIWIDQEKPAYYARRADIEFKLGDSTQAMADYNKAIEVDPDFSAAYVSRAVVYYEMNDFERSWADVHKAQKLGGRIDPDFYQQLQKLSGRKD